MNENQIVSRRKALKTAGVAVAGAVAVVALGTKTAEAAKKKAPRWAMVIDARRCTGCRTCTIADKAEYDVPLGSWQTVVREVEMGSYPNVGKTFLSKLCNHCEGDAKDGVPPCVKICPEKESGVRKKFVTPDGKKIRYRTGATYKRPDGMILIDNSLCIGCGKCIKACPYGARSFNKRLIAGKSKLDNGISKCSFCRHRVDNGVVPACASACPNKVRNFGDLNDPGSEVSKLVKEFNLLKNRKKTTILPEEGTKPMIFYIDPKGALSKYKVNSENKMEEFKGVIS